MQIYYYHNKTLITLSSLASTLSPLSPLFPSFSASPSTHPSLFPSLTYPSPLLIPPLSPSPPASSPSPSLSPSPLLLYLSSSLSLFLSHKRMLIFTHSQDWSQIQTCGCSSHNQPLSGPWFGTGRWSPVSAHWQWHWCPLISWSCNWFPVPALE